MHDPAIELLILGNNPSEVESYLTTLRNSGTAVHAQRIGQDLDSFNQAIEKPVDIILYTKEAGEIGLETVQGVLQNQTTQVPVLVLAERFEAQDKSEVMS